MKSELLPPLALMTKWRTEEGLSPQQVKERAEAWASPVIEESKSKPVKVLEVKQVRTRQSPTRAPKPEKAPNPTAQKRRARAAKEPAAVTTQNGRTQTPRPPKPAPAPFFPFPAPAGLGYRCDAFHLNPAYGANPDAPRFVHCRQTAIYRLVIRDERRARSVKRCSGCAYELRYRAVNGLGDVKIEADEPLKSGGQGER